MKVSVVIPVYNAQETIVRALDSVINQTIKPFEIVIIDGVLISQSLS
jgi:glycosyltransferase involved in cell wall biosynthesis